VCVQRSVRDDSSWLAVCVDLPALFEMMSLDGIHWLLSLLSRHCWSLTWCDELMQLLQDMLHVWMLSWSAVLCLLWLTGSG
jgi:hypothetical protein